MHFFMAFGCLTDRDGAHHSGMVVSIRRGPLEGKLVLGVKLPAAG
jgi:hypothetical protein